MYKNLEVFKDELSYIKNEVIRNFFTKAVTGLPDYFFEVAASSTGKYHPSYSLGSGGLVRHTKAAVKIAYDLLNLEQNKNNFTSDEADMVIGSLICHDGLKHGDKYSKYTIATHPTVAAEYIKNGNFGELPEGYLDTIVSAMSSHMGEFNTDFKTKKEILPKPVTPIEQFVHMCDYLASRKYLIMEFEDRYEPENYKTNELEEKIKEIVEMCKDKIKNGVDRNELYTVIANNNFGNKNPNSITDIQTAERILIVIGGEY